MENGRPKWVKAWIAQLAMLNDQFRDESGAIDFSALGREEYRYRMALIRNTPETSERAKDALEEAVVKLRSNALNGQKGGRPRKSLPTKDEIYAFAAEAGLDDVFAREWYELSIKERKGRDRDGNPIANWQAALTGYVTSRQLGGKR